MGRLVESPIARYRVDRALSWLSERKPNAPLLIVAATLQAGAALLRAHTSKVGATFGWQVLTLGQLAGRVAAGTLAMDGRVPIDGLATAAVTARVVDRLAGEQALGIYSAVADRPGLVRATASTLRELAMDAISAEQLHPHAPDLARISHAYQQELDIQGFADRASVFDRATHVLRTQPGAWVMRPILFLDVALTHELERRLCAALLARARSVLCTVPSGDALSRQAFEALLDEPVDTPDLRNLWDNDLARLQHNLFEEDAPIGARDSAVELFSAPGEVREAVEIARRIQDAARKGTRFDRMAVLLRSPERYRAQLTEAFTRAEIPACFTFGTLLPDPAGRALLSLLRCKAERLSATRFAEYLSLGVTPDAAPSGAPPEAVPATERWVQPDSELSRSDLAQANEQSAGDPTSDAELLQQATPDAPVNAGTLRAPWRWERVLVDAAVIGGRERWQRRLDGTRRALAQDLAVSTDDDARRERLTRGLADLDALRTFAMPLIDALDALPDAATWGDWIEKLSALATRALRSPERVIAALAELSPMASVGPVSLHEVQVLLTPRLSELCLRPAGATAGKVWVASIDEARGFSFDVVFVPGLAEKMFPQKVREDPLLLDADRRAIDPRLTTNEQRVAKERLALRIAVGAAARRVVLSFPRVDTDKARPRVPSFYGLEAMRAVTGKLPSFDELMRDAEHAGQARIGMPAPRLTTDAIDAAEFDLAVLQDFIGPHTRDGRGVAHYLLEANPHLARSLRARARRWTLQRFTSADGLLDFSEAGRAAMTRHALSARAYSASALQAYAACPYRFALRAIHGLAPRQVVEAIETLDPQQRGMMIHRAQFLCLTRLRDTQRLPITDIDMVDAEAILDQALDEVVAQMREDLAPAIERVWQDGVAMVRADLRAWLRRMPESDWVPSRFELAFGIENDGHMDPASTRAPITLDVGLQLRGAIDLVETRGQEQRASDHKTGNITTRPSVIIGGGTVLQPVLYALALEKLIADRAVTEGRLYYCTVKSRFEEHRITLNDEARASVQLLTETLASAIDEPFLPAAPDRDECSRCDYTAVCGPYEEQRVRRKDERRLRRLRQLRALR